MVAGHEISILSVSRRYLSKSSEALSVPICGTLATHSVYHELHGSLSCRDARWLEHMLSTCPRHEGLLLEETFCDEVT